MTVPNRLYFGDCLDVLREDVADESVDLVYLDPPFNSKRLYNAFIGDAQWVAFNDTWHWSEAVGDFHAVASSPGQLADTMEGLRKVLGEGPNLAYLAYMANRLRECWRALKPTGSLYLHCDPTMSHYLKVVLDAVFGSGNFRNEIVWHYRRWTGKAKRLQRLHDIVLFYTKRGEYTFNVPYDPYTEKSLARKQNYHTRIKGDDIYVTSIDKRGVRAGDVWNIPVLNSQTKERVGYPTQKPLALLNRIVQASSNPGDVVLDPFCGCGTTVHAAQGLNRRWIGVDICVTACQVIEKRLRGHFDSVWDDIQFIGMPKTLPDAKTLASMDKFRFERWAASIVDGMEYNKVQRGDKGIDGRGRIAIRKGQFVDVVSQVKGGGTGRSHVQAFDGARREAGAELGIFTCFEDRVTQGMRDAAASTGRFMDVPRIQIYTVDDYYAGRRPRMPRAA